MTEDEKHDLLYEVSDALQCGYKRLGQTLSSFIEDLDFENLVTELEEFIVARVEEIEENEY